jgi:hypothetical protein
MNKQNPLKIEKIENKNIAPCHKCSNKIVQQDLFDKKFSYIAGCKQMTNKEWENNMPCPTTGLPHIRKENNENNMPQL